MIKTETITINGTQFIRQFIRTYSDLGCLIEREGIQYSEAVDPVGSNRIYTEVPGTDEDIDPEEALRTLEEIL